MQPHERLSRHYKLAEEVEAMEKHVWDLRREQPCAWSIGRAMESAESTPERLVVADGVTEIPDRAYKGQADIREVVLPASVVKIGDGAFERCTGIVALHLPDALESLGEHAFRNCSGIVALHLPDVLTSLDAGAFFGCTGIVDLHLPDALRSLGHGAFAGCTGIASLVLPKGLTAVGQGNGHWSEGAFGGCTSLARVLAPDGLARGETADPANVFKGCPVLAAGLTPHSAVPPLRRTLWHPTVHHTWCTPGQRACVLAVLVAELRSDRQPEPALLPSLPHDVWLLILQFVPRHELGAPPPPAM